MTPAPFPYYGGKGALAGELVGLLPESRVFVDVFGGSAAVLLARPPANGRVDVYNDADAAVVTFFRVLRDRPDELVRLLELTPFSRAEWLLSQQLDVDDELELARRFYVRVAQSYGASPAGTGWAGQRRGGARVGAAIVFRDNVDERLRAIAHRLRAVQLEQLEWPACLDRYDAPGCAFYLDPPYVPDTRVAHGDSYRLELTLDDHEQLVGRLLELEGSWLLSGYAHEVYAPLDDVAERFEWDVRSTASRTNAKRAREVVWRRLAPGAIVQQRLAV